MNVPKQIGDDVWIKEFNCSEHPGPCGVIISFDGLPDDPDSMVGTVTFASCKESGWHVVQIDPLTLIPSIRCKQGEQERHGFITNGKWVEA